ncbi:MAG: hypothetical protein M3M88_05990 [Thermoproteota archaeon]|nr:hypothetical protein [Thermoproteota archaeon]
MTNKNKRSPSLAPREGLYLSVLSGISLFLIFYMYSKNTAPENAVYINQTLYNFALSVFISFFVFISVFLIGIKKAFFPRKTSESNPSTLMYHVQYAIRSKKNKLLFLFMTIIYFVFFAFLSNIFIFFNADGSVFSLFPKTLTNDTHSANSTIHENSNNGHKENDSQGLTNHIYPKYNLIICCNSIGYVPMLILSINSTFSILLIPINFLLGVVISILVGFNITFNIYLIRQIKKLNLSKRNFFSIFGITSGLFIGCPTCAGSFFYSLAGFSSLITFSFLSVYQIIFVFISIPLLVLSVIFMAKLLQKKYLESCKIK